MFFLCRVKEKEEENKYMFWNAYQNCIIRVHEKKKK